MNAQLLGVKVAQDRLGIKHSKMFELLKSGELRSVKIGKRRLIPEQAIVEFITRLEAQAGGVEAA